MSIENDVLIEDINELTVRLDALSNVVTIVINSLSENQPSLHDDIIKNIEEFATSLRTTLGDVDEEDIADYAYSVAESMEHFLPLNEGDVGIGFIK